MKSEVKSGILITVVVIVILVIVYFATAVFLTGEISFGSSDSDTDTSSNNDETEELSSLTSYDNTIIAGRVFNQTDDTYMVIIYSEKDSSDALKTTISTYDSSGNDITLYKVNKDEAINSSVNADSDNTNPASSSELKVQNNALLTITNHTVSSYISDDEQIINALK